jgi:hypothetical protein
MPQNVLRAVQFQISCSIGQQSAFTFAPGSPHTAGCNFNSLRNRVCQLEGEKAIGLDVPTCSMPQRNVKNINTGLQLGPSPST